MNTKRNKTKQCINQHAVYFVFVSYPWAWGLPWSEVDISRDILLEEADFPFPSGINCK